MVNEISKLTDSTPPGLSGNQTAQDAIATSPFHHLSYADQMDSIAKTTIDNLPTAEDRERASEIASMFELACESPHGSATAASDFRGATGELARHLHRHLQSMGRGLGRVLDEEERRIGALSFIGKVFNNEFQSNGGRWAANVANVCIRSGLSTAAITLLRQQIATAVHYALLNGNTSSTANAALANAAMLLGPILNTLGAILDEKRNIATAQSRAGRLAMLCLSTTSAALVARAATQSAFAAGATSILLYAPLRDLVNSQVPLDNNAGGIKMSPTAKAALTYGGAQYLAGESMDYFAPVSGAGAVTAAGQAFPNTFAADATRGAINGAVEISDDLLSPYFSRKEQIKTNRAQIPLDQLLRADIEGLRIKLKMPFAGRTTQEHCFALRDQFLTTGAMRLSAFEAVNALVFALDMLIGDALNPEEKGHLMNGVVAVSIAGIYPAFVASHYKRNPAARDIGAAVESRLETA